MPDRARFRNKGIRGAPVRRQNRRLLATDGHTGLATPEENNFFGKHSGIEPEPGRWNHIVGEFESTRVLGWEMAASGYAAAWARGNIRRDPALDRLDAVRFGDKMGPEVKMTTLERAYTSPIWYTSRG